MTDLGEAEYILGLQISRDRRLRTLSLSQSDYIRRLLERFGMSTAMQHLPLSPLVSACLRRTAQQSTRGASLVDGKHTYASVVGAIMYAMLGTRPDLAFAIGQLTRFNSNPGPQHVAALKRVLRYLRSSIDFELTYGAGSSGSSGSDSTASSLCSVTVTRTGPPPSMTVAPSLVLCLPSQGEPSSGRRKNRRVSRSPPWRLSTWRPARRPRMLCGFEPSSWDLV